VLLHGSISCANTIGDFAGEEVLQRQNKRLILTAIYQNATSNFIKSRHPRLVSRPVQILCSLDRRFLQLISPASAFDLSWIGSAIQAGTNDITTSHGSKKS
jgi:hypothetical protein